jgi:hypothetical protein
VLDIEADVQYNESYLYHRHWTKSSTSLHGNRTESPDKGLPDRLSLPTCVVCLQKAPNVEPSLRIERPEVTFLQRSGDFGKSGRGF